MKNNFKLIILTILICFLFISCMEKKEESLIVAMKEKVKVLKIKTEKITPEIRSFGTITYFRKVDISVTTDGIISSITKEEGEKVTLKEKLAKIENIQLQIRKKQIQAEIQQAQSALELTKNKLREANLEVEAQLYGIRKTEIELEQKLYELNEMEKVLKNKKQVFDVGGISQEAMDSIKMQFQALKTDYEIALEDLKIRKIGLRDEDIKSAGFVVPENDAKRIELLKKINTLTLEAEVDVAKSRVKAAATDLESVNQLLNETTILSPLTGIIGARFLEEGELIKEGTKLLTLFNINKVYAVFPVRESDMILITEGMDVGITIDAFTGKNFDAKIQLISPMVDPQTGNVSIKAVLENHDHKLKPGMFLRARIISGATREAILIPKTSIFRKSEKNAFVFTVVQKKIFSKQIRTGEERENRIEVLEGIVSGDLIVDSPSPILKEGEEVEIEE